MDQHMEWILSLAANVRSQFQDKRVETLIGEYLKKIQTPIHSIIINTIINNNTCPYLIVSDDPKKAFYEIVDLARTSDSDQIKSLFKPITVITKLADREFMLDINGERMIYGIRSSFSNSALIKSMISRAMYSVKNYFELVDPDTHSMKPDALEMIDLQRSFDKDGGRSKKKRKLSSRQDNSNTPRVNVKIKILSRLIAYVKANQLLTNSLIYLNTMDQIDNHALDIIYNDTRIKDAVIDYLKLLVEQEYSEFTFEYNPHKGFFVPYDFRLRKLSCYIKHKKSGQNNYLVNLYNSAMYDPIPAYKLTDHTDICQLIAHPLVKLRFLYLDLYLLNSKLNITKDASQQSTHSTFASIIHTMIESAYRELAQISKTPFWIGMYRDENYDRNQENMKQRVEVPFEVIII